MSKKMICQLYAPAFYRSFGVRALKEIKKLLPKLKKTGFDGIYIISLWEDGGADNGFDIVSYNVKSDFGTDDDLMEIIEKAHGLGMTVGVDVVPNHVSDKHPLAQNCLHGLPGYEDVLYSVTREEAERLTEAGVPSFFGKLTYSPFGDRYIRSTFADYKQLNLNWGSDVVREYFRHVFGRLSRMGIDFFRIDCGMLLLEDVSKADPQNPMAVFNPEASINVIREVSGGAKLFFEWFDTNAELFESMPECWALDCSYVMSGIQNLNWKDTSSKLVPLVGGHDQMTLVDRGISPTMALFRMMASKAEYVFLDIQTLIGYETVPEVLKGDEHYDANLENPNQRYRARRPIVDVLCKFEA